jgi:gas vesicle protein
MTLTVKEGILEGMWQKFGHLLVMGVSGIVLGYALLLVGNLKDDILFQAAEAADKSIATLILAQDDSFQAHTQSIKDNLNDLTTSNEKRIEALNDANNTRTQTIDGQLDGINDKIEANRLEAKADTIRLEGKLSDLQKVLIDEIRKN